MAGVIRDLRTFSVAVNTAFKTAFIGNSGAQHADQLATEFNMSTREVEFPIIMGLGPMRLWEGSRIVEGVMRDSYRITTQKYEKTIGIEQEDVEDDNLDLYLPAIKTAAIGIANWKAQAIYKKIEENGPGYDKKPMFAIDHQERGLNVSNFQDGVGPAWYMLDLSKPIKPWLWGVKIAPTIKAKTADTDDNVFWRDQLIWGARARGGAGYGPWQIAFKSKAALDGPSLEAAIASMRDRRDEHGESLDVVPTTLLVPPALEWDARRLLGPATIAGGADNIYQGAIPFLVSNRLTGV
jgi:phage major head subunit gpT-like protein